MPIPQMTAGELSATLEALDLTLPAAGRIFATPGVKPEAGERKAQRWMVGTSKVPAGVAIALRIMRELKISAYPLYLASLDREHAAHPGLVVPPDVSTKPARKRTRKPNG